MINASNVPIGEVHEEQNKKAGANRLQKIATASALGIVSIAGFIGQRKGIIQEFPQPTRSIAESCSHPVLGYVGAWFATTVVSHITDRFRVGAAIAGASTANFVTESMQSTLLSSHLGDYNFLAEINRYETAKDYVGALMGMGLFMLMDRNPGENIPTPDS